MTVELLLPGRRISAPKPPSYLALDMAFGVGAGAVLGDKSRYRSHGAITGAAWAAGVHGYCLDFDPTIPSYVVIPAAHTQLNFTSENFSGVARIYVDPLATSAHIFTRGLFNADGYVFYMSLTGRLYLETYQLAASQQSRSAINTVPFSTWCTVGWSRAGASGLLYRNGVVVNDIYGVHVNPATCARSAKIGIVDNLITYPFDGRIEFLRIFRGIALPTSSHLAWHNALV